MITMKLAHYIAHFLIIFARTLRADSWAHRAAPTRPCAIIEHYRLKAREFPSPKVALSAQTALPLRSTFRLRSASRPKLWRDRLRSKAAAASDGSQQKADGRSLKADYRSTLVGLRHRLASSSETVNTPPSSPQQLPQRYSR